MENILTKLESEINASFLRVLNVTTPGSDLFFKGQDTELMWGRSGNDTIVGLNLGADNSDRPQIDFMVGDGDPMSVLMRSQLNWSDRFVLGDWKQLYYADSKGLNFGLKQFASILDFNPKQDIIQLHGISKDYQLVESPVGTAIFWNRGTVPDLIAVLPGVYHLSREANYFQYKGYTPPPGPVIEKTQQLGSVGLDVLLSSATDPNGNLYVAGATSGYEGKVNNAGSNDVLVAKYDNNGNQQWIKQFGTSNADFATNVATDKQGNYYLVGMTKGDLGKPNQGQGNYDVWFAKYDSDGNQQWIEQFGTELIDATFSIKLDDDGNVYLSGFSVNQQQKGLFFQPGVFADKPWVTKYDSNGNQQWFKEFGSASLTFNEAYGVAVSNDGSVYSTGWALGDEFGKNAGLYDVWVAKNDNNGNQQWIKQFGTKDYEFAKAIDIDSQGNVYITGWTLGDLSGKNAGSYDAWVTKYDSNGNQKWIKQFGTDGDDGSFGMKVDSDGNIFLTGYTNNSLAQTNAGSADAWVGKYDTDGNQLWIQQFGTSESDVATSITVDNQGHVFVTGTTEGSFGGINAGSVDSWVAKLNSNSGTLQDFSATPKINQNDNLIGGDRPKNITKTMKNLTATPKLISQNDCLGGDIPKNLTETMQDLTATPKLITQNDSVFDDDIVKSLTGTVPDLSTAPKLLTETSNVIDDTAKSLTGTVPDLSTAPKLLTETSNVIDDTAKSLTGTVPDLSTAPKLLTETSNVIDDTAKSLTGTVPDLSTAPKLLTETSNVIDDTAKSLTGTMEDLSTAPKLLSETSNVIDDSVKSLTGTVPDLSTAPKLLSETSNVIDDSVKSLTGTVPDLSTGTKLLSETSKVIDDTAKSLTGTVPDLSTAPKLLSETNNVIGDSVKSLTGTVPDLSTGTNFDPIAFTSPIISQGIADATNALILNDLLKNSEMTLGLDLSAKNFLAPSNL
ncbi:MAG: SBBP repeat-containing protein [Cyanomargarita calcarea GSE-NOS-MK-12-04C]|jgi:methyl-accepting chemotaxis protein|uniref:SBBP repeat-containing protein n=1 Tax=Cyanomargarita calcarea GSE-NOS-MK-12-04C TaxID=2839659 RepID=A0A951QSY7_9CYAN|nr:SBBP repeat-containing protein [Cyanomargarita calcarea GSE-NOS-MK-12-04C]